LWQQPWNCKVANKNKGVFKFLSSYVACAGFVLCSLGASAQLNNRALEDEIAVHTADSLRWGMSFHSFNYLRNTEYFNNVELGRTLFGTQLHPSVFFQPNSYVKLQAGVFLQSDFGATPYINRIVPTLSLKISSKNNKRSFTFGTLEGALAHRLIEPMFDISSAIEKRIENGAQFKINNNRVFLDTWINWEKYIQHGSPHKEGFTAGFNFTPAVIKTSNNFAVNVPLQGTAFHRGGQIDADSSNMIMVFNAAAGIELKKEWPNAFVRALSASSYYALYKENSNSGYFPRRGGQGIYPNLFIDTKWLALMVSYWQGNNFISPRGTPLYQSVSVDKPGYTEKKRDLLFVRFLYQKELHSNLTLAARFEPVYDVNNSIFDFSYSMYLVYRFNRSFGY
jgi:hypothetical protein